MSGVVAASYLSLWLLVMVEGALLFLMCRRLGANAGHQGESAEGEASVITVSVDMDKVGGLALGMPAPAFRGVRADGSSVAWAPVPGQAQLIAYVAADCDPCANIIPFLVALARTATHVRVTLAVRGTLPEVIRATEKYALPAEAMCLSGEEFARAYRARFTPFAYVVSPDGRIVARGLSDAPERLQALLDAVHVALPSIAATAVPE